VGDTKLFYLMYCFKIIYLDITELTSRDTDVNKKNLMILVGSFTGFMKTKSPYGSNILVCQAGFKTLNEIAKV
jgi:hypothetical protein